MKTIIVLTDEETWEEFKPPAYPQIWEITDDAYCNLMDGWKLRHLDSKEIYSKFEVHHA